MISTRITGTGSAFPKTVMTNYDLVEKIAKNGLETSDEWIRERTGIAERRLSELGNEDENCSSLAKKAAEDAMKMAGISAEDLDFILFATCTPDTRLPAAACYLQSKLGAKNAWVLDINAACSGFVYGLDIANLYITSDRFKKGLVIGAEKLSSIINWEDRGSCILFGDGAGAAIVERAPNGSDSKIISCHLGADGNLWNVLHIEAGGSNLPLDLELLNSPKSKMDMNGREVFKVAVRTLTDLVQKELVANNLSIDDIDWFVPHQANLRILEAVAKRINLPTDKIVMNVDKYGNTSSATVPTALNEAVRDGRIKRGDLVLMDVFGAGLTYGSMLVRW